MKRARGHASAYVIFGVVIVGVVRVCVARARSHGRWGLSAVTAVRVPRPAPSRSASGEVRLRGPPSARCARRPCALRFTKFVFAITRYAWTVVLVARYYVFYARYVLVFTRAWPAVGSAGTRRILSSKTVTFAGFFGSRRGPRSRGAGESSRGAVRVTFRLRFVTGESPDLACTLVAAAQRTTLL